ncbi:MAG: MiaB/RimO family radical SAM methylthiotransferase [candidate division Zixibacteria bacterium]|nr:MiaB/RimO family radical SAM methylthiotransferase [candidate division Zixibacteria bacterium]
MCKTATLYLPRPTLTTERRIQTFHVTTFGCQMNLADSSTLVSALVTRGFRRVESSADADLIILNTCSVREKAEQRVIGRLGELSHLRKQKPWVRIAVVGCMAQRLGSDLVTISRGCDNFCTYCIVPHVRGREQSHSVDHILNGVRKMVSDGVVEVMLLGQNVNSYQHNGTDFPDLLRRVARETEIKRIRFMTSHPRDLSDKLIRVLADEPKIMPHVHLPLQAGSDRVLEWMGRKYTLAHYLMIVDSLRSKLDYLSLTTDLIVGFPGETRDDYQMTLDAVQHVQFDAAFMFRYSVRPGTKAAGLVDDVPEAEKISRLNQLIDLQKSISYERNQREVGQVRQAMVEGYSRRSDKFARARTEGNKTVLFRSETPAIGRILPMRITAADAFTLHGETVEELTHA